MRLSHRNKKPKYHLETISTSYSVRIVYISFFNIKGYKCNRLQSREEKNE